ncbi:MAG: FKBP-type peptidyl-prolyl cis-trans isomerase [Weeksellaceae bacterium]|nr:FKBP-type peptidyl-prolyl cis-trans isomerase [Weeksellaceae bacterium]
MKISILLASLLLLTSMSCRKNPPQYPTVFSNDGFLEYSKKFNKDLVQMENEQFIEYMQTHPGDFIQTTAGFYMTRTAMDSLAVAEDRDTISFTYRIDNIQDSTLYNYETIGRKTIVMGQTNLIPGIEYALKRMQPGEEATVLVPSTLAYGLEGDGAAIGADQPLIVYIKLFKIF